MLKLEYSPKVTNALMKAFPRYTQEKAEKKLSKYINTLERLMRRAKLNKQHSRKNRNIYELEAKILWDKTGQLGTPSVSLHKILMDNRVPLVINTNHKRGINKELAKFRKTSLLTVKNESLVDLLRSMTSSEVADFLDQPSQDDIDEINNYLQVFRSLSSIEQHELYDTVQIDIDSLKNYIIKLVNKELFIEHTKLESDADNAEFILRIAQLNSGQLPQLKEKSDFGRTYYKNLSVQNVSKRVRKAMLGDCWEYDSKSCAASWKMAFAHEFVNRKKKNSTPFENQFNALTLFLEYKSDFFNEAIDKTFLAHYPYTYEHKTKIIKGAMTAVGFGAKLTMGSWKASNGEIKSSSLLSVFDDKNDLLRRFVECTIVQEYNSELSILNKYIVDKFSLDPTWISDLEASRIKRQRKSYSKSQKISWLFQHAETEMMNLVRDALYKLGKTVLANVHDAIVVRERLSSSELLAVEQFVRTSTNVQYFALGETSYSKLN